MSRALCFACCKQYWVLFQHAVSINCMILTLFFINYIKTYAHRILPLFLSIYFTINRITFTQQVFQFEKDHDDKIVKHTLSHLLARYESYTGQHLIYRHTADYCALIMCLHIASFDLFSS